MGGHGKKIQIANMCRSKPVLVPSGETAAYIAGLFDGEGNLHRTSRTQSWIITITNTNADIMQYLTNTFKGGSIGKGTHKNQSYAVGWALDYRFRICGAVNVLRVLRAMLPFLIIKRLKAETAIEDIESRYPISEMV